MIIKFRSKAPETNSSSAHSLVWDKNRISQNTKFLQSNIGWLKISFSILKNYWSYTAIPQCMRKLALIHNELVKNENWELLSALYQNLYEKTNAKNMVVSFGRNDNFYFFGRDEIDENRVSQFPEVSTDTDENWKMVRDLAELYIDHLPVHKQAFRLVEFIMNQNFYFFDYEQGDNLLKVFKIPQEALDWYKKEFAEKFNLHSDDCLSALSEIVDNENPIETIIFAHAKTYQPINRIDYNKVSQSNIIRSKFNWNQFCFIINEIIASTDCPFTMITCWDDT